MDKAYAAADLAVCRAGASTCAELAVFGVPALLVPYPMPPAITNSRTPAPFRPTAPPTWSNRRISRRRDWNATWQRPHGIRANSRRCGTPPGVAPAPAPRTGSPTSWRRSARRDRRGPNTEWRTRPSCVPATRRGRGRGLQRPAAAGTGAQSRGSPIFRSAACPARTARRSPASSSGPEPLLHPEHEQGGGHRVRLDGAVADHGDAGHALHGPAGSRSTMCV